MWRQPEYSQLDAPPEIKNRLYDSIYVNFKGKLRNASTSYILQTIIGLGSIISFTAVIGVAIIFSLNLDDWLAIIGYFLIGLTSIGLGGYLYWWGWLDYYEAWYNFDENNEVFEVIQRDEGRWEMYDVPFEQVNEIKWKGGENGRAIIRAVGLEFPTNRSKTKRKGSVTELWDNLARIDAPMRGWPIELKCQQCDRTFGHHIGTATCPFDNIILIDPNTKGRIDPKSQHQDDLDRI